MGSTPSATGMEKRGTEEPKRHPAVKGWDVFIALVGERCQGAKSASKAAALVSPVGG